MGETKFFFKKKLNSIWIDCKIREIKTLGLKITLGIKI